MKKDYLVQEIEKELAKVHPELELQVKTVKKTNDNEKEGVTFTSKEQEGIAISPTFYLEDMLQIMENRGISEEEMARRVVKQLDELEISKTSESFEAMLNSIDKTKIFPSVINLKANQEMLREIPHRIIAKDLALIARYQVTENGTFVIKKEMEKSFKMTEKEILDTAILNAEGKVEPIYQKVAKMTGMPVERAKEMVGTDLYVSTNSTGEYGAATIYLNELLRKQAAKEIGGDYYILPSSIHECLCISADSMTAEEANAMIQSVNRNEVAPEEILSDHCYFVDAKTLEITIPKEREMDSQEEVELE